MLTGSLSSSACWDVIPNTMLDTGYLVAKGLSLYENKIAAVGLGRPRHVWDVDTQTWTELPVLPRDMGSVVDCIMVTQGNKIFLIGGMYTNAVKMVSLNNEGKPESSDWRLLPPMASVRCNCGAAAVGGSIVVAGGYNQTQKDLQTAEIFDVEKEVWGPLPDMKEKRCGCVAVSVRNKFFVFGGKTYGGSALNTAECLDLSTKTWESLPTMPHYRYWGAAVTVGDRFVLLLGGQDENSKKIDAVDCFDTDTNEWVDGVLPDLEVARCNCAAAFVQNHVYVLGGINNRGCMAASAERIKINLSLFHQEDEQS